MDSPDLRWQPMERKSVFSTKIFDIREIKSRSPENDEGTFYTLHATDWVIVIPVIKNENGAESFVMVRQWRHGAEMMSIEFPGGVIDEGEEPIKAAKRELLEETGFRANNLIHAATISPNPAIMDNQCHIFFAANLENTHRLDLDDDEFVMAETVPVEEVIAGMGHGAYIHGLMSAALFVWIQKNGLPG